MRSVLLSMLIFSMVDVQVDAQSAEVAVCAFWGSNASTVPYTDPEGVSAGATGPGFMLGGTWRFKPDTTACFTFGLGWQRSVWSETFDHSYSSGYDEYTMVIRRWGEFEHTMNEILLHPALSAAVTRKTRINAGLMIGWNLRVSVNERSRYRTFHYGGPGSNPSYVEDSSIDRIVKDPVGSNPFSFTVKLGVDREMGRVVRVGVYTALRTSQVYLGDGTLGPTPLYVGACVSLAVVKCSG